MTDRQDLKNITKLNRFTTLPFLIDILTKRKITLLNPKTWDDHNDLDIILDYKHKAKIIGLLALCFTYKSETVHHWKAFANGESGCCIEFDGEKLLNIVSIDNRIRHKKINYLPIKNLNRQVNILDIPFTKRYPYNCEAEYRIIIEMKEDKMVHEIDIPIEIIKKITLSPQMPFSTFEAVKKTIVKLTHGTNIIINPSTLYNNEEWISNFKKRTSL